VEDSSLVLEEEEKTMLNSWRFGVLWRWIMRKLKLERRRPSERWEEEWEVGEAEVEGKWVGVEEEERGLVEESGRKRRRC